MNAISRPPFGGEVDKAAASRPAPDLAAFIALADKVKGCWRGDDGLAYQERLRAEWTQQ